MYASVYYQKISTCLSYDSHFYAKQFIVQLRNKDFTSFNKISDTTTMLKIFTKVKTCLSAQLRPFTKTSLAIKLLVNKE